MDGLCSSSSESIIKVQPSHWFLFHMLSLSLPFARIQIFFILVHRFPSIITLIIDLDQRRKIKFPHPNFRLFVSSSIALSLVEIGDLVGSWHIDYSHRVNTKEKCDLKEEVEFSWTFSPVLVVALLCSSIVTFASLVNVLLVRRNLSALECEKCRAKWFKKLSKRTISSSPKKRSNWKKKIPFQMSCDGNKIAHPTTNHKFEAGKSGFCELRYRSEPPFSQ